MLKHLQETAVAVRVVPSPKCDEGKDASGTYRFTLFFAVL
jgi:hypothetical protein